VLKIRDLKVNPADQSTYYQNQTVQMLDRISQQLASVGNQISTESYSPLPYPTFHPSASDRRVNILWLLSLVLSLFAAFLATLVQQWSQDYLHVFQQASNPLQFVRFRLFLFEGSERLPALAETVHGSIHFSLVLFFWGLCDMIFYIDTTIFVIILVPIALCVSLYLYYTIAPIWNPQSPYRTPFSNLVWFYIQNRFLIPPTSIRKHQEQSSMKATKSRMNRDVRAIRWLVDRINSSDEMHALILAIPGSFNVQWGREVWKQVVGGQSTSLVNLQARSHPGFLSACEGPTVYELCRRVRYFFETYKDEGNFVDAGIGRTRCMRGYIETAASLVCCAGVELCLFGEVGEVLSEVGGKEQTNDLLSIKSTPLFTLRWTCLSLVTFKKILVNDNHQVQELAKFALDGIAPIQTNLGSRDAVTMALTVVQKMDDDLKKAWEAVLDLRLALGPWCQNQNKTVSEIKIILNTCEASIQELERIAMEAVGMEGFDWRIRCLQETMDEVTHKLTRRLPGVFFDTLHPTAISMTSEASDQPSVQSAHIIPQLIFPEWDEESLKSLNYLRKVPIPLCGLKYLMERQLWRLLDLRDGGGLGFTIELFFLALRQLDLSSASPSPDESSSELKKAFYTGTFDIIASNWKESKNSVGTQGILLDLLGDIIIQGRGVFSDFLHPQYIVEMLLNLVGKIVEGLGQNGPQLHIDDVLDELMDESLMYRTNIGLRDEVLDTITRSLSAVPS
jgi:hypothetical protein